MHSSVLSACHTQKCKALCTMPCIKGKEKVNAFLWSFKNNAYNCSLSLEKNKDGFLTCRKIHLRQFPLVEMGQHTTHKFAY